MKICVFSIWWNEAKFAPYFLRHYSTFASKIVVFCEPSTDGTEKIVESCPIAELRAWPHRGLDDDKFLEAVNSIYKEARGKFDWVIWADCDELLWHPGMLKMLSETKADILQATGYAMISRTGLTPVDGQIYDHYRQGIRQFNYDKAVIWRPEKEVVHTLGRHTYGDDFPKCNGVRAVVPGLKLLHYHFFGVEHTLARNRRNFARVLKTEYGWNSAPPANSDPKQSGGAAWVEAALRENRLVDVFTEQPALKKIHLGSGGHKIIGWENHDMDMDIRKPLPLPANSVSHIFIEHATEHVTHQQAWNFFEECHRVLVPGGVLRVAIPDMALLSRNMTQEYQDSVKASNHGDGNRKSTLRATVFEHGHQAAWTQELLATFLSAIGFQAELCQCGKSRHHELNDIEQHWKTVGRNIAEVETGVVEGTKI